MIISMPEPPEDAEKVMDNTGQIWSRTSADGWVLYADGKSREVSWNRLLYNCGPLEVVETPKPGDVIAFPGNMSSDGMYFIIRTDDEWVEYVCDVKSNTITRLGSYDGDQVPTAYR